MKKQTQRLCQIAFVLYLLIMLWLLFGQRIGLDGSGSYQEQLRQNLNLIPLKTIGGYLRLIQRTTSPYLMRIALANLAGNVVMFVPLGFFLPCLWEKLGKWWKSMLLTVGIIVAVELVLLVTLLGSCDIDDLILNVIGAFLGYGLFRVVQKRIQLQ